MGIFSARKSSEGEGQQFEKRTLVLNESLRIHTERYVHIYSFRTWFERVVRMKSQPATSLLGAHDMLGIASFIVVCCFRSFVVQARNHFAEFLRKEISVQHLMFWEVWFPWGVDLIASVFPARPPGLPRSVITSSMAVGDMFSPKLDLLCDCVFDLLVALLRRLPAAHEYYISGSARFRCFFQL